MNTTLHIIIFGTGMGGKRGYRWAAKRWRIVAFVDNNPALWHSQFCGKPVIPPHDLENIDFDRIVIASVTYAEAIAAQLQKRGVPEDKLWMLPRRVATSDPPRLSVQLRTLLNPAFCLGSLVAQIRNYYSRPTPPPKTILVAIRQYLWPVSGGGPARTINLINYLRSEGYRIVLVVPHSSNFKAMRVLSGLADGIWTPRGRLEGRWDSYSVFRKRHALRLLKLRRRYFNLSMKPFDSRKPPDAPDVSFFEKRRVKAFERTILKACRKEKGTAVIAVYAYLTPVFDTLPKGILKISDTIDVQYTRLPRAQALGESLYDFDPPPCKEEETALLRKADAILAIQSQEKNELAQMAPELPVLLAEHAVSPVRINTPDGSKSILFIGSFYAPNIHGISCFIQDAWPQVRQACPEATLDICGNVCEALQAFATIPGVRLHGLVPRLEPFYRKAALVINPVQYGTGLKIKAVEALSHGKCLIATEQGVLGLPSSVNDAACIVTMDTMAATASELLNNPQKRKDMEKMAFTYACETFSPHVVYQELGQYLKNCLI